MFFILWLVITIIISLSYSLQDAHGNRSRTLWLVDVNSFASGGSCGWRLASMMCSSILWVGVDVRMICRFPVQHFHIILCYCKLVRQQYSLLIACYLPVCSSWVFHFGGPNFHLFIFRLSTKVSIIDFLKIYTNISLLKFATLPPQKIFECFIPNSRNVPLLLSFLQSFTLVFHWNLQIFILK